MFERLKDCADRINDQLGPHKASARSGSVVAAHGNTFTALATLVERFFNNIKQCRHWATRYDKLARAPTASGLTF